MVICEVCGLSVADGAAACPGCGNALTVEPVSGRAPDVEARWGRSPQAAGDGGEVALSGVRAEFRTALLQEVDAARRSAASNAVGLVNGRRIAQVGGAFQYAFSVENALNVPSDTPGELRVPGHAPMSVSVLALEGLNVTLSVPNDLGGFVPTARLVTDLTFLLLKLIERLEAIGDSPNPAGDRIRGALPASGRPLPVEPNDEDELNPEQLAAVASAVGRDTTFVWGPPGTGKTRTIGAIGRELFRRRRSLLLVSHTNTAVDQALLRIGAATDRAALTLGLVVRVGEPRDPRLQADENKDLLLATHVERRSEELAQRKTRALAEREECAGEVLRLHRLIEVTEWVEEAAADLDLMAAELAEVREAERQHHEMLERHRAASGLSQWWRTAAHAARVAEQELAACESARSEAATLRQTLAALRQRLEEQTARLGAERGLLSKAEEVEPLRARLQTLPPLGEQRRSAEDARARAMATEARRAEVEAQVSQARAVYQEASTRGRLARLWRQLPDPEQQRQVVERLQGELTQAESEVRAAHAAADHASGILGEVLRLTETLRPHAGLPQADEQRAAVSAAHALLLELGRDAEQTHTALEEAQLQAATLWERVEAFGQQYGEAPARVLERAADHATTLSELERTADGLGAVALQSRRQLESKLQRCLTALQGWFELPLTTGTAEVMLSAVQAAHSKAAVETEGLSLSQLRARRDELNGRIRTIDAEVASIDEALKRVEEDVISDAVVVATTLTRAYLRDSIQSRRFDTVVLDEASIAPVPALWVAASLATASVVAVGDPEQLPPIVTSKHPLARKWLGKDIFHHARVAESASGVEHLVALRLQYRMHPHISAIPNTLIYGGRLEDAPQGLDDGDLEDWYGGHDDAVLLVDMGPVGAWVTSVPRGENASRLNFLSATVCTDLAEQLLRQGRPEKPAGGGHRILIVCPYRSHASLLQLLLREQRLDAEVLAGTAHHFQGSEAPVVILDLVNDEPHWRVKLFAPAFNEDSRPLLNVALTRAQRRLVVVGDFDYIKRTGGKAFLGGQLIPLLEARQYRRVSALDVVPAGLAARAARAQTAVAGGDVEAASTRLVMDQAGFYQMLAKDLESARSRVVIYSAFVTQQRLAMLEAHLRAAAERGVELYVVTKDPGERRSQSRAYRYLEQTLRSWGVTVVHKRGMHEKLVFVDDRVIWTGSLNPLSYSDTQEVMERRESREVVEHYARIVRLDDLLRRYTNGMPTCPSGHELFAAEGPREPFYWRCTEDGCFTCSIDEDLGEGGVLRCAHAGCGAAVAYGEWGGRPAWRCTLNPRHHRKLLAFHLCLPRMRGLIPNRELRRLDMQFGIRPDEPKADAGAQGRLDLGTERLPQ